MNEPIKLLTREEGYTILGIPFEEVSDEAYMDEFCLDRGVLEYVYVPSINYRTEDRSGYLWYQIILETGEERYCGNGGIWSDWSEACDDGLV